MRALTTVSGISTSLLMAAALSLCPPPSSAAAPTMQWDGDQTVTGNHVTLGNAGVGTSTPSTTLHVYKDVDLTAFTGTTLGQSVIGQKATLDRWGFLDFNVDGSYITLPLARIGMKYTSSGTYLAFGTSSNLSGITNQAMTIDSAGKVGIGTASPSSPLNVNGPIELEMFGRTSFPTNDSSSFIFTTDDLPPYSYPFDGNGNLVLQPRTSGGFDIVFATGSPTPSARMVVKGDGKVGIGTVSPSSPLNVNGPIELEMFGRTSFPTNDSSSFIFTTEDLPPYSYPFDGNGNLVLQPRTSGGFDIVFATGTATPSARMVVKGDGKVGIGIPYPAARFHAVGCAHYDNANMDTGFAAIIRNNVNVCQNCSNQQAHWGLKVQAGSNNGGGTTHAIAFFDNDDVFRGSILVTSGSIELSTQSDARLKRDIVDTRRDGLAMVKALPVRDFTFIDNGSSHTGFIAQELEPVYPEAVQNVTYTRTVEHHNPRTIPEGALYKGVLTTTTLEVDEITTESVQETVKTIAPMMLIPILWKAVQEQQAQKEDLATKSTEAETRLAALEKVVGISGEAGAVGWDLESSGTLSEEATQRVAEAVLKKIGVDPWVEITAAEAWEEVDETAPVSAVETVTRYRFNPETRLAEAYSVQETVTRQAPTGRRIVQLKKDVRLDDKTGKFHRWCGLGATANGVTLSQNAVALLGKLLPSTAVSFPSSLRSPVSKLKPQGSIRGR